MSTKEGKLKAYTEYKIEDDADKISDLNGDTDGDDLTVYSTNTRTGITYDELTGQMTHYKDTVTNNVSSNLTMTTERWIDGYNPDGTPILKSSWAANNGNQEWYYPTGNFSWKARVRFDPMKPAAPVIKMLRTPGA